MRMDSIDIENFRCVKRLKIELHEKTNIFVGINGSGKSAVLECLSVLLSRLLAKIRSPEERGRLMFSADDVTIGEGTTTCKIGISAAVDGDPANVSWTLIKHRRRRGKGRKTSDLKALTAFADKISKKLYSEQSVNLPLALYYPVNRDVIEIPLRLRKKPPFEQLSAYDGAIGLQKDYFRTFFAWFRNREDFENERRVRHNPEYRDRELEAVRTAIETFMDGFSDLQIQRSPLRMVIWKGESCFSVGQLSDGEKCLLALVGEIARRLAMANPAETTPLRGAGIILIDEVDLHLHPAWQRMIVPRLEKTFPNCQLILTTHSPQVLSHVHDPNGIFLLKPKYIQKSGAIFGGGYWAIVEAHHPESAYGLDSNRILEEILDVSSRPPAVKQEIQDIFRDIDRGELESAKQNMGRLKSEIGDDPELVKAQSLIRRMEILGK